MTSEMKESAGDESEELTVSLRGAMLNVLRFINEQERERLQRKFEEIRVRKKAEISLEKIIKNQQ